MHVPDVRGESGCALSHPTADRVWADITVALGCHAIQGGMTVVSQAVAGVEAAAQRLAAYVRSLNGFELEPSGEWPEGLDASAVDHHLARFLAQVGVETRTRDERKAILNAAAELLGVDRVTLVLSIWSYMADYLFSSYKEAMLEHLLIGEIMRVSWPIPVEVYKPQVAAVGVDLLLVRAGVTRAVQLKISKFGGRRDSVNVHTSLWDRPRPCVIWTLYEQRPLRMKEFLWLGEPGPLLPPWQELKEAKHTKGNAQGEKAERPALRVIPKSRFKRLTSVRELVAHLFEPVTG